VAHVGAITIVYGLRRDETPRIHRPITPSLRAAASRPSRGSPTSGRLAQVLHCIVAPHRIRKLEASTSSCSAACTAACGAMSSSHRKRTLRPRRLGPPMRRDTIAVDIVVEAAMPKGPAAAAAAAAASAGRVSAVTGTAAPPPRATMGVAFHRVGLGSTS
jgi:hypothetical protein